MKSLAKKVYTKMLAKTPTHVKDSDKKDEYYGHNEVRILLEIRVF